VRTLWGVTGVSKQIAVEARPNTGDIKSDIMGALKRSWFKPERVDVTAANGAVTLTGKVNTWSERELAASTAWAAPGVSSVTNDVRVR